MNDNFMKDTNIYKISHIYENIKDCLIKKKPFAIARIFTELNNVMKVGFGTMRSITQGIPKDKAQEFKDNMLKAINEADYVSVPGAWLTKNEYIDNSKSLNKKGMECFVNWENSYKEAGITNTNYCNPDIGYLLFMEGKYNLWNIIKDKKVCFLTSKYEVYEKFEDKCHSTIIQIPEMTTRQEFKEDKTMTIPKIGYWHWDKKDDFIGYIKNAMSYTDIFLMGAGHIGKAFYCPLIKENGGICIDVGKAMDTWAEEGFGRMKDILEWNNDDHISFQLTENGKQYEGKF